MIVSISDTHLGYDEADRTAFTGFLDYLQDDLEPDHLVLNGDIEDLWRRDIRTVTRDDYDVFSQLEELEEAGTDVHYVLGNHDWYARHDTEAGTETYYTTDYVEELEIEEGDGTYTFLHGHQFDPVQQEPYFDLLARVTDDALGEGFDRTWEVYNQVDDLGEAVRTTIRIAYDRLTGGNRREELQEELTAMDRCQVSCDLDAEMEEAVSYRKSKETDGLVFGHTHVAAATEELDVVNSGAWLDGEYTYVVIEDEPRLMVWNDGRPDDVTERFVQG